jgi:hypothetical protein
MHTAKTLDGKEVRGYYFSLPPMSDRQHFILDYEGNLYKVQPETVVNEEVERLRGVVEALQGEIKEYYEYEDIANVPEHIIKLIERVERALKGEVKE